MKRRRFIRLLPVAAFLLAVIPIAAATAQGTWEPMGPRGATIVSMARDPFNPGTVYSGAFFGGLHRSMDGGISWQHLPSPFSNRTVLAIALDTSNPGTIYVGTFQAGVFRSTDGGASWAASSTGLTDLTVQGLAFIPNTGTLLAATFSGVFRSSNAGASWNPANSTEPQLVSKGFFADPSNSAIQYLATTGMGIHRSADDGQTWALLPNGLPGTIVNHIVFPPPDESTVWVSTNAGIRRIGIDDFRNGTGTWDDVGFNLSDRPVHQGIHLAGQEPIFADGDQYYRFNGSNQWDVWAARRGWLIFATPGGEFIHIGGTPGLFELTGDNGQNFYPVDWGMQNRFVGALAIVNVFGWWVMYAGTDIGVEFTSNFFFSEPGVPPWLVSLRFDGAIFDIVPDPQLGTLYAGTERGGVWKTVDFGSNWRRISSGIAPRRINALVQADSGSGVLYAGTSAGMYVSRDQAGNWSNDGNKSTPRDVTAVAVQPGTDLVAIYGTRDGQIFRTFDAGNAFSPAWSGIGEPIRGLAIAPFFNVYLATESGGAYSSTDEGLSFFPMDGLNGENVSAFAVDPVRPWIAYAATRTGGVFRTETRGLDWTPANTGITDSSILSIANSRQDDALLYAGATGAVFRTTNGAGSWQSVSAGLPNLAISRLHVSAADDQVVYATINEADVYRTTNGGQSWSPFYTPGFPAGTLPFIEDETESNRMYAGSTGGGVSRSLDAGQTWLLANDGINLFVRTIATTAASPGTVYAGSLSDGMFKSTDLGESWSPSGLDDRNLLKVVVDPVNPNIVYAGTSVGVSRSTDAGATWSSLGQLLSYYFDLYVDPLDPQRIFGTGIAGAIAGSTDSGVSWTSNSAGLPLNNVLAFARNASGVLFAAPELEGVFVSNDSGQSWTRPSDTLLGLQITRLLAVQTGGLFAGTQASGLFASPDNGVTWWPLAPNLDSPYVSDIVESPTNTNLLFLSTRSADAGDRPVFRSVNGGATWTPSAEGIFDTSIAAIAFGGSDQELFAASDTRVYRSADMGDTWEDLGEVGNGSLTDLLVDDTNPATVFASSLSGGVYRSVDSGQNWEALPGASALVANRLAWGAGNRLLVGTLGNGLVTTADLGATWTPGANAALMNTPVLALAVNPIQTDILYAGTGGSGVHRSTDNGANWVPVNTGLGNAKVLTLLIDPASPNTLYVGTADQGVFVTTNAGASWTEMNDGLFNRTVTSLSFNTANPAVLVAGTEGGGVFQVTR